MQLDLFLDGRETILVNDLVAALLAGRLEGARDALNRLRKENPAHPDLAAFDRLVRSVCEKPPAPPSTGEPGPIIERLTLLVPAANRLLGLGAAAFLLPWWQALARTDAVLDPAEAAPLLRYWMGSARWHDGDEREAVRLWLALCWLEPESFARQAPTLPSRIVREAWAAFDGEPDPGDGGDAHGRDVRVVPGLAGAPAPVGGTRVSPRRGSRHRSTLAGAPTPARVAGAGEPGLRRRAGPAAQGLAGHQPEVLSDVSAARRRGSSDVTLHGQRALPTPWPAAITPGRPRRAGRRRGDSCTAHSPRPPAPAGPSNAEPVSFSQAGAPPARVLPDERPHDALGIASGGIADARDGGIDAGPEPGQVPVDLAPLATEPPDRSLQRARGAAQPGRTSRTKSNVPSLPSWRSRSFITSSGAKIPSRRLPGSSGK